LSDGCPPFGRQPGVVEVEPADLHADVVGGLDRIEFEGSERDARTTGHVGAGDQRPEVVHAFLVIHCQRGAGQ
jgi:hypothetical protein